MKKYHGYEVDVYRWIPRKNECEDPCDIVPHYFLEEDAARKFFDKMGISAEIPQVNFYECTFNMEGSQVLSTDDVELIDQKY